MKKSIAILGTILLVLGVGLSWTGLRLGGSGEATVRLFGRTWEVYAPMAGRYDRFHISRVHETSADVADVVYDGMASSAEVGEFSQLSLDIELGEVTIAAGDSYMVDISYWGKGYDIAYVNDGSTLQIWSSSSGITMGNDCGSVITVYVPWDAALEFLTVQVDLGSVTLAGLTVGGAELFLNLGDLTGEGLTIYDFLNVDADLGSVVLYGDLGKAVDIDADLGEVTLGLSRPASDYCWDLRADLGSITVDGRQHGNISASVADGYGDRVIYVDADLGSINMDFDCAQGYTWAAGVEKGTAVYQEAEFWSVPAAPDPPTPPSVPSMTTPSVDVGVVELP